MTQELKSKTDAELKRDLIIAETIAHGAKLLADRKKLGNLPLPTEPLVQGTTGLINPVWYKYFEAMRQIINQ